MAGSNVDSESDVSPRDLARARARQAIGAPVVYEAIKLEGEEELARSSMALAWSGLAAGASMGLSLVAEAALHAHLPAADWRPLLAKFGYSVGFLVVILGRQQLFTENTLTPILPLLDRKSHVRVMHVLRLWTVVLLANLAGAALFAWGTSTVPAFDATMRSALHDVSWRAVDHEFLRIFTSAIYAGWLVALIVWLLPAAESAKLWVIVLLAYLIGLGGFAHVIAGSVEACYLVINGSIGIGRALGGYTLPALLGNIIGGVMLVALLNYAQVVGSGNGAKE